MIFENFEQLLVQVNQLRGKQQFIEGIGLLEAHKQKFSQNLYQNLFHQLYNAMLVPNHELALDLHEQIVANNMCTVINWDLFDPLRTQPRFIEVMNKSEALRNNLQQKAKMTYEVHLPDNYVSTKPAPLFIALHGDSNDMATFKSHWQASYMLKLGFVVLYVQSSQVICTDGFGWVPDFAITRADIVNAYQQVCDSIQIDKAKIVIGGFSGGAIAAIEIAMAAAIDVSGFVSLCPSIRPASFNIQAVQNAAKRNVKGVILVGELDANISVERQMMTEFDDAGLAYHFHVNKGVGHEYPKDLEQQIETAVNFIFQQ